MMNRRQIADDAIEFEDFAASSFAPFVGQECEIPMNAFGSVVARYAVTHTEVKGDRIIARAKKVS